jgi:CubicO group peptidase (beta-lactamase class C family)
MAKLKPGLVLLIVVLVISPVASGFAQEEDRLRVTDQMVADFGAVVEAEMVTFHIPGVAVAIIQDGNVLYTQGFGVRDVATGEPFTPETRFRVGSTTKSMTSLLVAQAVDEGKLTWDTPVTEILPAFQTSVPDLTAKITVRDLMGMGTGLVSDDIRSLDWGAWTVDDLLAAVADQVAVGAYRVDYSYNNEVYALAGYAAVAAAGQDPTLENYAALLQARLFDPAGMSSAILTDDLSLLGDNYARSYEFTLGNTVDTPSLALPVPINVIGPAGGVWVNIDDMARYLVTQMNGGVTPDGTRIVSAENLGETWKPGVRSQQDEEDTHDVFYDMGWVNMTFRDVPARFHDGGWEGYRTLMVVLPEANVGLIIFANHTFGDLYNLAMLETFAEMLYGLEPQALDNWHERFDTTYGSIEEQVAQLPPAVIAPGEVAPLLGEYEANWTVEQRDDDTLWLLHGPWQFALQPLPMPYSFVVANSTALGTMVQFVVEGDQVSITLGEGDVSMSVKKVG